MGSQTAIKFIRIRSAIDSSFWSSLSENIIDEYKDSSENQEIFAEYTFGNELVPPIFSIGSHSFVDDQPERSFVWRAPGILKIYPNLQTWKGFDASRTLSESAESIGRDIESGAAYRDPQLLTRFILVVYPDVKRHYYQYWFGLPAITPKLQVLRKTCLPLDKVLTQPQIASLNQELASNRQVSCFFAFRCCPGVNDVEILNLTEIDTKENVIFAFFDPASQKQAPSWILRNFVSAVAMRFGPGSYVFVCLKSSDIAAQSTVEYVTIADPILHDISRSVPIGWETNANSKPGPRSVDLGMLMSPEILSSSSTDLNLRLMKWRQFPELNLPLLKSLKVLIVGAGTLGCSVARDLAAWGVQNFVFIDNGQVSFSNPVRQSLYQYEHCSGEKQYKADVASKAMKQICPAISAIGRVITVGMVGHPIGPSNIEAQQNSFLVLQDSIEESDITFLLTDSRESRWLPTLIAKARNKMLIDCALGFDTFVVMRHGMTESADKEALGCYFCSDVTAPGDSISDRLLDQQCTITRPGVAPIAAALAVELAVSWMHRPGAKPSDASDSIPGGGLSGTPQDTVPHQIRGWLAQYRLTVVKGMAFQHCIACSEQIVSHFLRRGWNFVLDAINHPSMLEEISGLQELKRETDSKWEIESGDSEASI